MSLFVVREVRGYVEDLRDGMGVRRLVQGDHPWIGGDHQVVLGTCSTGDADG